MAFSHNAMADNGLGVIAGLTSSSTKSSDWTADKINQYHAGLTYKIGLPLGFAVQPSVIYQLKGATLDKYINGSADQTTLDTKIGYVEVPVQVQWGLDCGMLRPYVFGEPFIGFGVKNETSVTVDNVVTTVKNKWDEAGIDRWEYGLGLGVGVEIWKLQISGRYFWNFGSLTDDEGNVNSDTVKETVVSAFQDKKAFNGVAVSVALIF
ncbi:MAG: PorT family protein [Bacteroidales bacterium]|nr:PorT family protein [Bacteroidales bacterium]